MSVFLVEDLNHTSSFNYYTKQAHAQKRKLANVPFIIQISNKTAGRFPNNLGMKLILRSEKLAVDD